MATEQFNEGVKPGGLTSGTGLRILLCYLLASVNGPVPRDELETVLLGEELVNYFVMAESLAAIEQQGLATTGEDGYTITEAGRTVAETLAEDVPRTVREAAVRGVIRLRQYAAKAAAHHCEVVQDGTGRRVECAIGDEAGPLFRMQLYMPDEMSAEAVRNNFVENGDEVYKLVLAALTENRPLAEQALEQLGRQED